MADPETDEERLARLEKTRRFMDMVDVNAWICQPPFEPDETELMKILEKELARISTQSDDQVARLVKAFHDCHEDPETDGKPTDE